MFKRVLVLAPHTDDAELGCGGTLAKWMEAGTEVFVATFSSAEESRPPGSEPYLLRREFYQAMRTLGVPEARVRIFDFPVRRFPACRQEILEEIVMLKREFAPEAVLVPAKGDVHQDHEVVAAEGFRAFKDVTVWGYELPWNHVTFSANACITLERRHLEAKWQAMQAYASQVALARPYFTWEIVESLARLRGIQVKSPYAEAFEVMRLKG